MLLLASAVAVIWSSYLHWLPCRGSMLSGSVLRGYAYGPEFTDACLRRMDTAPPFPYPPPAADTTVLTSALGVAATALAGLAWLVLAAGMRWPLRMTAVAALPGLVTLVVAVVGGVALGDATRSRDSYLSGWLWLGIDGSAVIAAIAILGWQRQVRGRRLLGLMLALWGSTAFGAIHEGCEYAVMIMLSEADWDSPPGTGYLTGVVLIISAVLTLVTFTQTPPVGRAAGQSAHPPATPRSESRSTSAA
jgi:hypothetical protein